MSLILEKRPQGEQGFKQQIAGGLLGRGFRGRRGGRRSAQREERAREGWQCPAGVLAPSAPAMVTITLIALSIPSPTSRVRLPALRHGDHLAPSPAAHFGLRRPLPTPPSYYSESP